MVNFSQIFSKYLPDESRAIIAKVSTQESLESTLPEKEQPATFQTKKNALAVCDASQEPKKAESSFLSGLNDLGSALFSIPIHIYRYCISPLLPPSCRFEPSCSAYALEALKIHGPIKGSYYTILRLLRCHPWGASGYDPVPLKEETTAKTDAHPTPHSIESTQDTSAKTSPASHKPQVNPRAIRKLQQERFSDEKFGVSVVAEPEFVFQASEPESNQFVWRCDISLFNLSSADLKLLRHMWTITKSNGAEIEISDESESEEETPLLISGAALFHSSLIPIDSPSAMIKGQYEMEDAFGNTLIIQTPDFSLDSPWANRFIH